MPEAYLLDVRDRDGGCATAHVDFRSNRPVNQQADQAVHRKLGQLVCDWWEQGPHVGRLQVDGYTVNLDLREYLFRDMETKGIRGMMRWCGLRARGESWLGDFARLHAHEIGQAFHEWNDHPTPAHLSEKITLPNGTTRHVEIDLRPWINGVLRQAERRRDEAPSDAA